jgi:hypothetical protein
MAIDTCKITVPGRHVSAGLPNTEKEPNRGSQGNTTRPWHTNTRTIRGFMVGMSGYGKPIADHLATCGECATEYVGLINNREDHKFSNFDRKGCIPKALFLSGQLPKETIPKAFSRFGFEGVQWLVKNGAKTEDVIRTAALSMEERHLTLNIGMLVRTPWHSHVPGPVPGSFTLEANYSWEMKEAMKDLDLLAEPKACLLVLEDIKFAVPNEKALLISQHVWALSQIGSSIPTNFRDLHRDGKAARALIEVNRA